MQSVDTSRSSRLAEERLHNSDLAGIQYNKGPEDTSSHSCVRHFPMNPIQRSLLNSNRSHYAPLWSLLHHSTPAAAHALCVRLFRSTSLRFSNSFNPLHTSSLVVDADPFHNLRIDSALAIRFCRFRFLQFHVPESIEVRRTRGGSSLGELRRTALRTVGQTWSVWSRSADEGRQGWQARAYHARCELGSPAQLARPNDLKAVHLRPKKDKYIVVDEVCTGCLLHSCSEADGTEDWSSAHDMCQSGTPRRSPGVH